MSYDNMRSAAMYNKSFGIDLAESYNNEIDRKQLRKKQDQERERQQ